MGIISVFFSFPCGACPGERQISRGRGKKIDTGGRRCYTKPRILVHNGTCRTAEEFSRRGPRPPGLPPPRGGRRRTSPACADMARSCLKNVNMPKRRFFFRHTLPILLEIHPVFLRQIGFVWRKNSSPLVIVPFFKQRLIRRIR